MAASILIVDDEEDIVQMISLALMKEGFQVACLTRGDEVLPYLASHRPSLILLDVMLPGRDGRDICKAIKSDPKTQDIPVIMVSAKREEGDIVTGFELGADDYVSKPFSPKVLVARVKNVLKRPDTGVEQASGSMARYSLEIHPQTRKVYAEGRLVELTDTEFRILHFLMRKPGWIYTRYQIVEAIRGDDYIVTDRAVDVMMVSLRKKLRPLSDLIETVRGAGYRFKE